MKYILTDTGFWRALLDKSDTPERHSAAREIFSEIRYSVTLILFPSIIYTELLNTNFFKSDKLKKMESLESILNLDIIHKIDETDYKEKALKNTLLGGKQCKKISFADNIIKLLAEKFQDDIRSFLCFDRCLIEECRKFVKPHDKCWEIVYTHKHKLDC